MEENEKEENLKVSKIHAASVMKVQEHAILVHFLMNIFTLCGIAKSYHIHITLMMLLYLPIISDFCFIKSSHMVQ